MEHKRSEMMIKPYPSVGKQTRNCASADSSEIFSSSMKWNQRECFYDLQLVCHSCICDDHLSNCTESEATMDAQSSCLRTATLLRSPSASCGEWFASVLLPCRWLTADLRINVAKELCGMREEIESHPRERANYAQPKNLCMRIQLEANFSRRPLSVRGIFDRREWSAPANPSRGHICLLIECKYTFGMTHRSPYNCFIYTREKRKQASAVSLKKFSHIFHLVRPES